MTHHTPAPMVHVPTCDCCGDATLLRRATYGYQQWELCAECYKECIHADIYDFHKWPVVPASLPPLQPPADYVLDDMIGATQDDLDAAMHWLKWCAVAAVGFAALVFVVGVYR